MTGIKSSNQTNKIMKKTIILALTLCISFISNAQWNKIKGNGNIVEISRSVGDYDKIAASGFFDVFLVDGKEGKISLKGESNLLDYIVTEVKDGKLNLKTKKGVSLKPSSWKSNAITITIPIEKIDGIYLSGSGDIVGKTTLKSDQFEAAISGSGDIELEIEAKNLTTKIAGSGSIKLNGSASNFEIKVSGSGDVSAFNLKSENVSVAVSGSADVEVTVSNNLTARVSGSGDINYRGNPKHVDSKASGSGDISKG